MKRSAVITNSHALPVFESLKAASKRLQVPIFLGGGSLRGYHLRAYHGITAPERDYDVYVASNLHGILKQLKTEFKDARITRHNLTDGMPTVEVVLPNNLVFHFATIRGNANLYGKAEIEVKALLKSHAVTGADFTANAMYLDVNDLNAPSRVFDPFNGRVDIKRKIIRVVSPSVFSSPGSEQALLRAARMAQTMKGEFSDDTARLMKESAASVTRVPNYRIRRELEALLKGDDPRRWLKVLWNSDVLKHLFPSMTAPTRAQVRRELEKLPK